MHEAGWSTGKNGHGQRAICQNQNIISSCCAFMHVLTFFCFFFKLYVVDVLTLESRWKHLSSWRNNKYGYRGYSQSSCWFMDANVVKAMVEGFNELCVLCIYWGRMTDATIFPFNSPSSMMCNSDAKGERVRKWCTALHDWWLSLFSFSCCTAAYR